MSLPTAEPPAAPLVPNQGPAKIHLFTQSTPNGYKPSVLLEELRLAYPELAKGELSYDVIALSFAKNEQKDPEYLKINPNGRIPAIIDDNVPGGHAVFESASILLWLEDNYDKEFKFTFEDPLLKSKILSWIFFAHGGVGPMQGQANHFLRAAPEKIPYGIKRYHEETLRLYSVLEDGLNAGAGEWLVGDKYTVADINVFPWVRASAFVGFDLSPFPKLVAWLDRIEKRPGAAAGLGVPNKGRGTISEEDKEKVKAEVKEWIAKV